MRYKHGLMALVGIGLSLGASADTLYLCRAYSGGSFWASTHCNQHRGLVERMVSVPDGMPFEQQVALGQQQRVAAARLAPTTRTAKRAATQARAASQRVAECKALEEKISLYVAQARQPHSGPAQDRLSAKKRAARDRQFELKC